MYSLLNDVRIIDLTTIVLGPFATGLMADMGADVIKVEAPGGDMFRASHPARSPGMGAPFVTINRNKRSLCLDLKSPGGRQALGRLVDTADVVIHNIRREPAERLGIDADSLRGPRPHLIHCSTPGYGSRGPAANDPAYDDIIQSRIGLAALLADDAGRPRLAPTIVADKVTGLYATSAILAALHHRNRTGEGSTIEVPMYETMASFLLAEHMGGRAFVPPTGPAGYNRLLTPHRRPHATRDGHIVLLPYSDAHWKSLLELIDDPTWNEATWVADRMERSRRVDELYALLGRTMQARTTADWLETLAARDIPAAPVNQLDDLFTDPHLEAVGLFEELEHPTEGSLLGTRHPVEFADEVQTTDRGAPNLGEHGIEILTELGYSREEIAELVQDRILITPQA